MEGTATALDEALIERLRTTGLSLDKHGVFWHEEEVVAHKRFHKALLKWLDLREDGRPILRLDAKRYAYVEVEDSMLIAQSCTWVDGVPMMLLNDGCEEELHYESLLQRADHSMHYRSRTRGLPTRIATKAYLKLAEGIIEGSSGFVLEVRERSYPIQTDAT